MKSKVVEFRTNNDNIKPRLGSMPFNESYLIHEDINEHVTEYTSEILRMLQDLVKGTATRKELIHTIMRAQYSSYLRGVYDERMENVVLEVPGMPKREVGNKIVRMNLKVMHNE